ncbi:MAG TPA: hypothetical protein VN734_03905 [Acidobacteriaceae bacterium]|nr:hypothetical protein [Acidobacteriaceae bacterium]
MPLDSPRPILSTPTLANATGFPARSLPTSTCVHTVVIVTVLLLGLAPVTLDGPAHLRQRFEPVDLQQQAKDEARLLPEMESSSASSSSPASASLRSAPGRNGPSSASSMPLIHQRRQHIISNTPDATNPVQTILQPDLQNPPRLARTIPIPSMVRIAAAQHAPSLTAPTLSAVVKPAAPPTPAPVPQPTLPKIHAANVDTATLTSATELADSPKLAAYATAGRAYQPPKPPAPPPAATRPSAPTVAANSAPSSPSNATPAGGTDSRNLLVVNAIDVQSTLSERDIPAAEIHGRFEVTASPSLPEAPTTGGSSSSAGVNGSGVATSGNGAGKGAKTAKASGGAGTGGTRGNGSGGGTANIAGAGAGHGAGLGTGTGSGSGHSPNPGMGNGAGNGSAGGNGSAPFSGMTIVGGTTGNGGLRSDPAPATINPNDPRGSYGLTILSHGGSGGAVRDYGVFTGGPVYTVYLDLSKLGVHAARWSFQYSASRDDRIAHPGVPLTPPLPQDERLPQLPPALVGANVGRLVVIQANLKADGKLEAFHVLESPDQRLNEGIVTSLTHWYFDPAAMGTDKIAVKVLFGIPIATAMADNGVSQQADRTSSDATPRTPAQ